MSQSTLADHSSVGPELDAQPETTKRTVVASLVAGQTALHDWDVFRTITECSQDTIHRLTEAER